MPGWSPFFYAGSASVLATTPGKKQPVVQPPVTTPVTPSGPGTGPQIPPPGMLVPEPTFMVPVGFALACILLRAVQVRRRILPTTQC